MLHISHHERVEGHPHRWHVFLHGRDQPIPVELDPEERQSLELTDEEIHDRLPTALERHHTENRDDLLLVPGEQYNEASWDAPVRLLGRWWNAANATRSCFPQRASTTSAGTATLFPSASRPLAFR
jgi:hypothetical protein